eukprot:6207823-Pleurochrysis_carterae.AAC.6
MRHRAQVCGYILGTPALPFGSSSQELSSFTVVHVPCRAKSPSTPLDGALRDEYDVQLQVCCFVDLAAVEGVTVAGSLFESIRYDSHSRLGFTTLAEQPDPQDLYYINTYDAFVYSTSSQLDVLSAVWTRLIFNEIPLSFDYVQTNQGPPAKCAGLSTVKCVLVCLPQPLVEADHALCSHSECFQMRKSACENTEHEPADLSLSITRP